MDEHQNICILVGWGRAPDGLAGRARAVALEPIGKPCANFGYSFGNNGFCRDHCHAWSGDYFALWRDMTSARLHNKVCAYLSHAWKSQSFSLAMSSPRSTQLFRPSARAARAAQAGPPPVQSHRRRRSAPTGLMPGWPWMRHCRRARCGATFMMMPPACMAGDPAFCRADGRAGGQSALAAGARRAPRILDETDGPNLFGEVGGSQRPGFLSGSATA